MDQPLLSLSFTKRVEWPTYSKGTFLSSNLLEYFNNGNELPLKTFTCKKLDPPVFSEDCKKNGQFIHLFKTQNSKK